MKPIFVHGSGGYGGVWKYQMAAFPQADFPSLPGHPQGHPCLSVDEYADWLQGYIEDKGYKKEVVLAGHSLGGAIVLSYALKYPQRLKALILIGTGARLRVNSLYTGELWDAMRGQPQSWLKRMEERYRLVAPEFRNELIERHKALGPAIQLIDLLCCHHFDIRDRLSQINVPTLAICGELDEMTPIKYTQYLASHIPGARAIVLPQTTHHLFMETPKEFNQAVVEFLILLRNAI